MGGFGNSGINISYNDDKNSLKDKSEYDPRKNKINICNKLIHHETTKKQFYTKNITDHCDLGYWTELL